MAERTNLIRAVVQCGCAMVHASTTELVAEKGVVFASLAQGGLALGVRGCDFEERAGAFALKEGGCFL